MSSRFTKKIPQLLSQYEALNQEEKTILQLISIIFEPTTSGVIISCLHKMNESTSDASQAEMNTTYFAILRKLQERDLLNWRYQCNPLIIEIVSRQAATSGIFKNMAGTVQHVLPVQGPSFNTLKQKSLRHVREMRIGLYLGEFDAFNKHLFCYFDCPETSENQSPLAEIMNNPFDPDWFKTLPPHLQLHCLHEICRKSFLSLESIDLPFAYLQSESIHSIIPEEGWPSVYYLIITNLFLRGDMQAARQKISEAGNFIDSLGLKGWLDFTTGNNESALLEFKEDLKDLRKKQDKKNTFFVGIEGLIYILALLKTGDYRKYAKISSAISTVESIQLSNPFISAYKILQKITQAHLENFKPDYTIHLWNQSNKDAITALLMGLGTFWINGKLDSSQVDELNTLFKLAKENGYMWLAVEYATLLYQATENDSYKKFSRSLCSETGIVPLLSVLPHEKTWQRALKALNLISREDEADGIPQTRIAWLIHFKEGFITISPKEQKINARGLWSQGRTVSLKRLYSGQKLEFLSPQDQKIQATLHRTQSNQNFTYEFDMDETLPALVGHPHLFLAEAPSVPVEFTRGEPELRAIQTNDKVTLKFSPPLSDEKTFAVRETPTRFKIIQISGKHRKINSIIGDDGLTIPLSAKKQVLHTLGNLSSSLTIQSDIGGTPTDIEETTACDKIIIQLLPVGSGFRISLLVRPFCHGGPYLYPGQGSATVIAEIKGKRLQIQRHLEAEKENCARIEEQCPTLARLGGVDGEWFIEDLQDCLEVLDEIQCLGDSVIIEWPEGEKLAIKKQVSFENFQLHIKKKQKWFELDGKLSLDHDKILEMKKLLELTQDNSGRFIPLGRGQFLALSREFRKQLDDLNSYTDQSADRIRIHPLASCALEQFAESGVQLTADSKWQDQLNRIRDSLNLQPQVPATLHAELRDYQVEGFKWLARLCHWGVGACLADDMGLGKTIQALGIILQQAPSGPSLVVAPTSVCHNWFAEINRFAPTLTPILFGGKARKKLIDGLKSFDVLICSYGLLQQEEKLLLSRNWQVIVLDEAQAIKNISTKRSRAAMGLEGSFKLITTGTPIENHLGELWNLFNFINPGLLGSLEHFNQHFGLAIEKENDKKARQKLKKLIQPFILRRLKSQVLDELPPRTEVVLQVDMSEEEAAFYEALRQQALEKIKKSNVPQGHKHMQILAQIMKLRQACCNPLLVQPGSDIKSSKLHLFGTIIDELLENRHKALVFSQFTGHLKIIRSYLDEKNISYQYLDGSTPTKKRQKNVAAFQAGEGDLFLISLKAGGLGLNLTAADYVIHMDPWWNPAAEDQASDRAHRIGQMRPVTVYRLVTTNSIEEKILKLHHDKRQLADSLLEGSDMSHKINADDLLQLLEDR
ncbi:MAG: DEAD/DEAH box helicase [Desulfobulbaceae bacterium]|nr:DEAD/DEAH box helicase [Desulfobulbaceae bacterium]